MTGGQDQSNCLNSGNFFGHFRVTSRLPGINCRNKNIYQKFGGDHGPPGPPGYATGDITLLYSIDRIMGHENGGFISIHIGTDNADKEGTTVIVENY